MGKIVQLRQFIHGFAADGEVQDILGLLLRVGVVLGGVGGDVYFFDFIGDCVHSPNGQDGKDGQDGAVGRGIDNAMIDNDGYLILTMTDGSTINAGLVRDTSAVANKEANDSATAKSLATAAVGLSGTSLLWNIAMLALSITMKRKQTTFHR